MDTEKSSVTWEYKVVINVEEQYSIFPAHKVNPSGWRDVGKIGSKEECLAYISSIWVDMRPLSVRKQMDASSLTQQRD